MLRRYLLLSLLFCLPLLARADDGMTRFHYLDLYDIQQSVADLSDLKGLRIDLYVTSTDPKVYPADITLTLHHASGATETIPHDGYDHVLLPVSGALRNENPLITTNQPKHSLNASVVIDLVPPAGTELRYDALMLGVAQLNEAIKRQRLGAMAKLYGHPADGLLIFYGGGEHSLTIHTKAGDRILKSTGVEQQLSHLKGFDTGKLAAGLQVIYVPLDRVTLRENPRVTLDAPSSQTLPAL